MKTSQFETIILILSTILTEVTLSPFDKFDTYYISLLVFCASTAMWFIVFITAESLHPTREKG